LISPENPKALDDEMRGRRLARRRDQPGTPPATAHGADDRRNQAAIDAALKRAATDTEFRKLALKDASAAVREITGKPCPMA
jgi:hypothetical protein